MNGFLILDDFIAHGEATKGLIDLIFQAKAKIAGIGIVIEKGFQDGGASLRAQGYRIWNSWSSSMPSMKMGSLSENKG